MSNYHKSHCSHCESKNWIYLGDPHNYKSTAGENPVAKCWKCSKKFLWNYDIMDLDQLEMDFIAPGWNTEKSIDENVEAMEDYEEGEENP